MVTTSTGIFRIWPIANREERGSVAADGNPMKAEGYRGAFRTSIAQLHAVLGKAQTSLHRAFFSAITSRDTLTATRTTQAKATSVSDS